MTTRETIHAAAHGSPVGTRRLSGVLVAPITAAALTMALGAEPLGAQQRPATAPAVETGTAPARAVRPLGTVAPTTESLVLDGALTEPLWEHAMVLPLRYEVRPGENIDPPVRTDVLLAYDAARLYVGFRCEDPDPSAIRARFSERDSLWNDDFVGIVLDTFNDERRAFEFLSNPLGVQADMLMDDVSGNEDAAWNAIWSSAGRITATGYEVEIVIPFRQLRFRPSVGPQTWGIDAVRSYPRRDRHHIGLFPRRRGGNTYLGQEEKITGFAGVTPGQNLEITPTLTSVRSDARTELPRGPLANVRADASLGVTTTWGITPNVTINGTVNPDFSQVEADAVQLDVNNQFALFYDETRPFFLEGSDFFRTTRLTLLHTRQVVQPDAAFKVSGKVGRQAFGFFSARDDETAIILPGSQRSDTEQLGGGSLATAGRYRVDVGANSTIGAMVTDRRGGGYTNTVVAVDTGHRFSAADSLNAAVAYSSTTDAASLARAPGRHGDTAVDLAYTHSVRSWSAFGRAARLGEAFRADLGFITQVDIRRWEVGGSRSWHGDETHVYNLIQVSGNVDETREASTGSLIEREWEAFASMNGPRESYVEAGGGVRTRVFNGVPFDQRFQSAYGEVRPSRALQFGLGVNHGDWIDFAETRPAIQRGARPFVNLNLARHLSVRFTHIYDTLAIDAGTLYTAHAPELRVAYQHDARTLVRLILQYRSVVRDARLYAAPVDARQQDLFAQVLFSYKVNAQTALYLGYTTGARGSAEYPLTNASRTLFAKFGYAWLR